MSTETNFVSIDDRLKTMGLILPLAPRLPDGQALRFSWCRVYGDRVYVSGHTAQAPDGSFTGPKGKVGAEVTFEQAQQAAKLAALSVLASVKRAIGDLDRVTAWLTISGLVNVSPGFSNTTGVIDGFSDLILDLFGEDIGSHARTAIGVAQLPLNFSVVIAAEIAFRI